APCHPRPAGRQRRRGPGGPGGCGPRAGGRLGCARLHGPPRRGRPRAGLRAGGRRMIRRPMRRLLATVAAGALAAGLLALTAWAAAPGADATAGHAPSMAGDRTADGPATPARRIVSLAPHITELLFAAGAGDRIVGASAWSDHPQAARAIPRIGD